MVRMALVWKSVHGGDAAMMLGLRALSGAELADEELLYQGKYAECEDACAKAILAVNTDPLVFVLKARVELTVGNYAGALKTCEAGMEANPSSLEIRLAAVDALQMNDRGEDAQVMLQSIVTMGE